MFGIIFVGEIEQKQAIWCLKRKSLNINLLFIELLHKINITFVIMLTFGEKNGTLRVILTIWNYINIDYIFWPHILNYVIYVIIQHHDSDTPSVKRWRRRPVWMQREPERAHTHVTHRMRVRTQITWTWLCTRGKKRYKCSFSHTNRSFRVLGHQCVVTMGNCLLWISLCMFFFPLIETVTYTCHYMTDRLERFDLKTSKLDLLKKKKTPTSWMPLG